MRTLSAFFLLLLSSVSVASERPNFLVILVDDMGYSDPQCFGGEIETPNLNQLADNGVRFSQFYNCARCCPTRASLLTGSYPHRVGLGRNGRTMDLNAPTVAELLKESGYQTAMTGKWHLSELAATSAGQDRIGWMNHQVDLGIPFAAPQSYPRQRGFDQYYGVIWGVVDFFDPFSLVHNDDPVTDVADDYYLTDAITNYSVKYIQDFDKSDKDPFFLYVAYTAPHWPLHAKPEVTEKYDGQYDAGWDQLKKDRFERQRKLKLFPGHIPVEPVEDRGVSWDSLSVSEKEYQANKFEVHAAMVDSVDQGIGRIVEALKETGEFENTVIFFLSDNGASPEIPGYAGYDRNGETRDGRTAHREKELKLPENRNKLGSDESYTGLGPAWANAANSPLKYWKKESYEGGCRTPFIVHWPAGLKAKAGSITRDLGHVMDIGPTCLELAGAKPAEDFPMDGVSMVKALAGASLTNDRILFFEHNGGRAARHRQWKISALAGQPWELYNLDKDPAETTNMIEDQPQRYEDLKYRWEDWLAQMPQVGSVKPMPNGKQAERIANQPVKMSCTFSSLAHNGVLVAQGGSQQGISLHLRDKKLTFNVRINSKLTEITTPALEGNGPFEVEALLDDGGKLRLSVNNEVRATGSCGSLIPVQPQDGLSIKDDSQSNVGTYGDDFRYAGKVTDVKVRGLNIRPAKPRKEKITEGKTAPNFIVILTDDQGWGTTSIPYDPEIRQSASDFFQTPNMERIANAGMRFTQAYSAHPNCSPSRAALLTGISPAAMHMSDIVDRHGGRLYEGNKLNPPRHVDDLDSNLDTIPELLKLHNRAYRAAHFGKWHLNGNGPEDHGFDESDGPTGNREGTVPSNLPDDPKRVFSMTRSSVRFMERQVQEGTPFYLQVSHYATHLGYQATSETIAELTDRKPGRRHNSVPYGSMIEDLDRSLGDLLDAVERLGISDNTYIIYTADNGTYPTEDPGNINGPLRGSKATLWEAGVRVPMMLAGPGIQAGSISRTPAIGWDILPTICEIVGIENLDERVEGGSLLPVLVRKQNAEVQRSREELYFHWPHYQHEKKSKPDSTVIAENFKLHYFWESREVQLFDLSRDLAEKTDVSEEYPEITKQLHEKLMQYLHDIDAQLPEVNPNYSPETDPNLNQ